MIWVCLKMVDVLPKWPFWWWIVVGKRMINPQVTTYASRFEEQLGSVGTSPES
jgi:hypothetical protein